jgi:hypothetical protein
MLRTQIIYRGSFEGLCINSWEGIKRYKKEGRDRFDHLPLSLLIGPLITHSAVRNVTESTSAVCTKYHFCPPIDQVIIFSLRVSRQCRRTFLTSRGSSSTLAALISFAMASQSSPVSAWLATALRMILSSMADHLDSGRPALDGVPSWL